MYNSELFTAATEITEGTEITSGICYGLCAFKPENNTKIPPNPIALSRSEATRWARSAETQLGLCVLCGKKLQKIDAA